MGVADVRVRIHRDLLVLKREKKRQKLFLSKNEMHLETWLAVCICTEVFKSYYKCDGIKGAAVYHFTDGGRLEVD